MAGAASVAASWERPRARPSRQRDRRPAPARGGRPPCPRRTPALRLLGRGLRRARRADRLPFTEDQPPEPVTPYGAEQAGDGGALRPVRAGRAACRIAVVRAFSQLGPGQSPAFAASGFARQIAAAEAAGAERVELAVGNLAAARDFTDVRDAARAFVEVSRRELTGTYNLCSGRALETGVRGRGDGEGDAAAGARSGRDPSLARPADPSTVYGRPGPPARGDRLGARDPALADGRRPARVVARASSRPPERALNILPEMAARPATPPRTRPPARSPRWSAPTTSASSPTPGSRSSASTPRTTSPRASRSASASPARRPSPAASTRACTATGSGRCASTPASPPPRTPTSATAT